MTKHIKYSDLNFKNSIAQQAIERGGGKNLDEVLSDMPGLKQYLPKNHRLISPQDAQDPEKRRAILEEISDAKVMSNKNIIRAAILPDKKTDHPGDFGGCVDFLPSVHCSPGPGEQYVTAFSGFMDKIIELAQTEDCRNHYQWEGGDPDRLLDHLAFIIQDFSRCMYPGSIVAHPTDDNVFIIEHESRIVTNELNGRHQGLLKQVINKDGKNIHGELAVRNSNQLTTELISIYKQIRDSGIIPEGYSFQIEFASRDEKEDPELEIYQLRLFRKKETKADFEINPADWDYVVPFPYTCYGKTSEGGIELPLSNLAFHDDHPQEAKVGYCHQDDGLGINTHRESPPLSIRPENMDLFWFYAGGSDPKHTGKDYQNNHLNHGAFRYISKAPHALAWHAPEFHSPFRSFTKDPIPPRIKYISNGVEAGIKFLDETDESTGT